MAEKMTPSQIGVALCDVEGWEPNEDETAIEKHFRFHDFKQAFAFMTAIAEKAEAMDHHPEWTNVYNRVDVRLSTHDAGGLTGRDFELAYLMDHVARDVAKS